MHIGFICRDILGLENRMENGSWVSMGAHRDFQGFIAYLEG